MTDATFTDRVERGYSEFMLQISNDKYLSLLIMTFGLAFFPTL
jgi:hypothetical protein